jgi:hypothetical protein
MRSFLFFGLGLAAALVMVSTATVPAAAPLASPSPALAPTDQSAGQRPACPNGWTAFHNPAIGFTASLPSNYWVRLRGGVMLTVEKHHQPSTLAFLLPIHPKPGVAATAIAEHFIKFIAQSDRQFTAKLAGAATADRAAYEFHGATAGTPTQGKFIALIGAGGTMAYLVGIVAEPGKYEVELPVLRQIAQSLAYAPAQGKWLDYRSPAGGFTLSLPQDWQVQSNDGQTPKDDIDWVAQAAQKPLSRVFQWCPRYCSPPLLQDPLHALRGYQAAQFQDHEQVITTSLGQISKNVKLLKMSVNQPLTSILKELRKNPARQLAALGVARSDIVVYDCLAQAQIEGQPVLVAFVGGIQTLAITGGLMDFSVTLRGWCAAPGDFVNDTPVLEKVCASMQLSAAFLRRLTQNDQQASEKIRETYDYMNRVDDQIRQSRWDTMDAIAEMNYDTLRGAGGYVNENTGRIEQIPDGETVKNSHGELVSREEVQQGVPPESAHVLRDAHTADYMRGVYGRVAF